MGATDGNFSSLKDAQNLGMCDLALERLEIALQVLPEVLQLSQISLPIILQLLANGLPFFSGGRTLEFEQEQTLLRQVFVRDLIEGQDQGLHLWGGALQRRLSGGLVRFS